MGGGGVREGQFNKDPLPVFSVGGHHGQGFPLFCVDCAAFPLPTTASSTLQGFLKNGFGETVMAFRMPQPCKCSSLDSCHKRFLWALKEVDLALHPVCSLVLQVGEAEKFPQALSLESNTQLKSNSPVTLYNCHLFWTVR